jgi:hypothetical protein
MGDNNRLQCRISCGAEYVIENVLPYLQPLNFVRSYVYVPRHYEDDSDSRHSDDDDE